MSFDLFLVAFRNGGKGTADAGAARAVLGRSRFDQTPDLDAYGIGFEDGSHVELYAGGLAGGDEPFDGGMFSLWGLSDAVGAFVFEFSRAAGCVVLPAMKPACVLVPREDLAAHLPADLGDRFQVIPVADGGELVAALGGGYDAWRAYRDRVVGESGGAGGGV